MKFTVSEQIFLDKLRNAKPGEVTEIPAYLTTDQAFKLFKLVNDEHQLEEAATREILGGGVKHDTDKPPLHLIPPEYLYAVAEILAFGAKKYGDRNWEKGLNWHRVYRAAIGHLFDWFARKGPDAETGKSHLWHAACCVMFLVTYEIRGAGTDDRP